MAKILESWTTENIVPLAPDSASIKAAQKLAQPSKWNTLASDETLLWGTIYGSGKKPYLVQVHLLNLKAGDLTYKCTCPSRKQPCKHTLALLFTGVEQPSMVAQAAQPDWVAEWAAKQAAQHAKKEGAATEKKPKDEAKAAKTAGARIEKMRAGLLELERWLENLMRGGLGDQALQSYSLWEERAARMVDAQAPAVAHTLRGLAGLPFREKEWAPLMLAELGRLYLLARTFRRFEALTPDQQADLRTALGWTIKQDEFEETARPVEDRWIVVGRYRRPLEDRLREQRIWLVGERTGRSALLLEYVFGSNRFKHTFSLGEAVNGSLIFYPGCLPLRAVPVGDLRRLPHEGGPLHAADSVRVGLGRYAANLAANLWQTEHYLLLDGMTVGVDRTAQDRPGDLLPLSNQLNNYWPLYGLGGERELTLGGLWDGRQLLPLAAFVSGRWVDLQRQGELMS